MIFKSAKYVQSSIEAVGKKEIQGVRVVINHPDNGDETWFAPINLDNSMYAEIMRQVDEGELTIEPADE